MFRHNNEVLVKNGNNGIHCLYCILLSFYCILLDKDNDKKGSGSPSLSLQGQ